MNLTPLEFEMTRLTLFWIAVELSSFLAGVWVLYAVIKAAIRDGIKESGLVRSWPTTPQTRDSETKIDLPHMKAER